MITATFNPPKKLFKTKIVWASIEGGFVDEIHFFLKKPKYLKDLKEYDFDTKLKIGSMGLCTFRECFSDADITQHLDANNNYRPKYTRMKEVFQIRLTMLWGNRQFYIPMYKY